MHLKIQKDFKQNDLKKFHFLWFFFIFKIWEMLCGATPEGILDVNNHGISTKYDDKSLGKWYIDALMIPKWSFNHI